MRYLSSKHYFISILALDSIALLSVSSICSPCQAYIETSLGHHVIPHDDEYAQALCAGWTVIVKWLIYTGHLLNLRCFGGRRESGQFKSLINWDWNKTEIREAGIWSQKKSKRKIVHSRRTSFHISFIILCVPSQRLLSFESLNFFDDVAMYRPFVERRMVVDTTQVLCIRACSRKQTSARSEYAQQKGRILQTNAETFSAMSCL